MRLLKNKRLWATLATTLIIPFLYKLSLPPDVLEHLVQLIMVYVGGQTASDVALAIKGAKTE